MASDPIKVAYIIEPRTQWLNNLRSNIILGSHPRLALVGEIINLREEMNAEGHRSGLCTCQKPYWKCSYWPPILKDSRTSISNVLNDNEDYLDLKGEIKQFSSLDKVKEYLQRGLKPDDARRTFQNMYLKYYHLARAILAYSYKDILVDSSKNAFLDICCPNRIYLSSKLSICLETYEEILNLKSGGRLREKEEAKSINYRTTGSFLRFARY